MAASSLLALIDDVASVLDDVAVLAKVAAKKTTGVLGDDLALNAEQVAGVRADRELPVVWAVAKGSARNKLILVPVALAISSLAPALVTPLLMVGGAFLCYEGFEKMAHRLFHGSQEAREPHVSHARANADPAIDLVEFEREKIKGAVRTDFVLSAEIVAISLGIVAAAPLATRVIVLSGIAAAMTVGVYGVVALIVKLDDIGLYLGRQEGSGIVARLGRLAGAGLLASASRLMKALAIAGTIAMFLVGGGIIRHGVPGLHHLLEPLVQAAGTIRGVGPMLAGAVPPVFDLAVGMVTGAATLAAHSGIRRLADRLRRSASR